MNYLAKFGIEYNPFNKNIKSTNFIELNDSKQILFRLNHLEKIKGIGLVTGEPGLGKTSIIRHWSEKLNKSLYKVIYIQHSTVSVQEFYRILSLELGLEPSFSKRKNFINIQAEIKRLAIEKKITPVIIIDEANYLSSGILNDLKLLFNFNMDSRDYFILLLVGQNSIRSALNFKSNEALRQRISINYSLSPLDKTESKFYIDTKLKAAGLKEEIISHEAYTQIISYCSGVMRLIDQIMDKVLLFLCNQKADIITGDMALEAINECSI